MDIYMKIPDSIEQFNKEGGQITAETLLKWHLTKNNIPVKKIPIRFTRIRPGGAEIDSRIGTGEWRSSDT